MKLAGALVVLAACHPQPAAPADPRAILARQTQELVDAVGAGRADVWERYLAPDVIYTAEDGAVKDKAQLVEEVTPLPPNISGAIAITGFTVRAHGATAIASYVAAETETYFGQVLHARYGETDTWMKGERGWQLVAAHVTALRDDPPAITLPAAQLDAYVGTYALTPEVGYTITRDGDHLVGQRTKREPETLSIEAPDVMFVAGQPRLRKVFTRGADGAITGFVERRESWDIRWTRAR